MKINLRLAISTVILLANTHVFADPDCGTAVGNTVLGKVTMNCQQVTGNATLTDSTITGKFSVLGAMNAMGAKFGSIDITGNATLANSIVNGPATVTGQLIATNAAFKDIEVHGDDVQLTASVAGNITIDSSRSAAIPTVQLNNKCTINGDITFAKTPGVVVMNDSKLTGKIINGTAK